MATTLLRFNCVQPGLEPNEMHQRYNAMLDMAQALDELGGGMLSLEEHHGAFNGWSPSPLIMAGAIFGRTKNISISISALLVPLHDPLRIAEDIAVLDLISGGKLTAVFSDSTDSYFSGMAAVTIVNSPGWKLAAPFVPPSNPDLSATVGTALRPSAQGLWLRRADG